MIVNRNRAKVVEEKGEFSIEQNETLGQIRDYFDRLIRLCGNDSRVRYCSDYVGEGAICWKIISTRDETDDEMASRIADEEKSKKQWDQILEILEIVQHFVSQSRQLRFDVSVHSFYLLPCYRSLPAATHTETGVFICADNNKAGSGPALLLNKPYLIY